MILFPITENTPHRSSLMHLFAPIGFATSVIYGFRPQSFEWVYWGGLILGTIRYSLHSFKLK